MRNRFFSMVLFFFGILPFSYNCSAYNSSGYGYGLTASDLVGTWITTCIAAGVTGSPLDVVTTLIISSNGNYGGSYTAYNSSNGSCSGGINSTGPITGTLVFGSTVSAMKGSASVTATTLDQTQTSPAAPTLYTLVYLDTYASPNVFYMGRQSPAGTDDGSSPANRHTIIDTRYQTIKQ